MCCVCAGRCCSLLAELQNPDVNCEAFEPGRIAVLGASQETSHVLVAPQEVSQASQEATQGPSAEGDRAVLPSDAQIDGLFATVLKMLGLPETEQGGMMASMTQQQKIELIALNAQLGKMKSEEKQGR